MHRKYLYLLNRLHFISWGLLFFHWMVNDNPFVCMKNSKSDQKIRFEILSGPVPYAAPKRKIQIQIQKRSISQNYMDPMFILWIELLWFGYLVNLKKEVVINKRRFFCFNILYILLSFNLEIDLHLQMFYFLDLSLLIKHMDGQIATGK